MKPLVHYTHGSYGGTGKTWGRIRERAANGSAWIGRGSSLRVYATQVEVLRRFRHGGQQYVRVEHVHINEGGQAVIGNVKTPDAEG
jgi:hypothetical protein